MSFKSKYQKLSLDDIKESVINITKDNMEALFSKFEEEINNAKTKKDIVIIMKKWGNKGGDSHA
jgi:hypothetical protein